MDLTEFINQYRGPLVGLIASWGAPWSDAHDIAQDAFAEAYLKRESCRGDWRQADVFGRWLRGVARNHWRNWRRSRRRRGRVLSFDPSVVEQIAAPEIAEPSERIQQLREAIDRLPPGQRQVILMRYFEETLVADIAALLSVTTKTVEGRLGQARRSLQRLMDGQGSSPSRIREAMLCL